MTRKQQKNSRAVAQFVQSVEAKVSSRRQRRLGAPDYDVRIAGLAVSRVVARAGFCLHYDESFTSDEYEAALVGARWLVAASDGLVCDHLWLYQQAPLGCRDLFRPTLSALYGQVPGMRATVDRLRRADAVGKFDILADTLKALHLRMVPVPLKLPKTMAETAIRAASTYGVGSRPGYYYEGQWELRKLRGQVEQSTRLDPRHIRPAT